MILRIAWRNIGRNPRRSAVLVGAVAVAVFAFVGSTAFMDGISIEIVSSAVDMQGGHVQVAPAGYHSNPTVDSRIEDPADVLRVAGSSRSGAAAPQVYTPGMANSSEQSAGVQIVGVDPVLEPGVTVVADRIVEGAWFPGGAGRGEVVVGAALAEKLRVRLGEKIVLMASDVQGDVSAAAYRIAGLYRTNAAEFDRTQVYLLLEEAQRLLSFGGAVSTVSIRLEDPGEAAAVAARIRAALPDRNIEALTWEERNPMLEMARKAYDLSAVLTAFILFAAVGFTLVNSFLMVIFERIHEIGIMLAQGVKPAVIRRMLLLEALLVGLVGCAAGIALSAAVLGIWLRRGLDLSAFAEGLGEFGVSTVIYPAFDPWHQGIGFTVILVMIGLSVLYPAIRASLFEAVEALHHV